MTKKTEAELNILHRVLYMLDEYSVRHVAKQDPEFNDYIAKIYGSVWERANNKLNTR